MIESSDKDCNILITNMFMDIREIHIPIVKESNYNTEMEDVKGS